MRIPNAISAAVIIVALLCGIVGLGAALSGPAASWRKIFPPVIRNCRSALIPEQTCRKDATATKRSRRHHQRPRPKVMPVAMEGTRLSDRLLAGTQMLVSGIFTTTVVLFFLLASGDTFLRRLVEVLPRFKDKRQAVDISQKIEQDISSYLLTITRHESGRWYSHRDYHAHFSNG